MDIARINNRNNFLFREFPNYHPESLKYLEFWRVVKRRVIEGYWGQDTTNTEEKGMWRFMPPQLYFYANLCYILHKKEGAAKNAPRRKVHPNLDDIDWDFSYKWIEARGFSGFSDDEEYTCCRDVELYNKGKLLIEDVPKTAFNKAGELKKYTPARTYINKLFNKPLGLPLFDNEAKNLVLLGSRGAGKELADYEPVITESGYKEIGNVLVGDRIYDDSGELVDVTGVFKQGVKPIYKITLTDGRTIDAGLEHLWEVYEYNKQKRVYTTKQLIDKGIAYPHSRSGKTYKFYLPNTTPVNFKEKNLPIPPYVLGALLGDGAINAESIRLSSNDIEIVDRFKELLPDYKFHRDYTTNNYNISYKNKTKDNWVNPLKAAIKELGVNKKCDEKFIPTIYKYASVEQRMELVRGLMDTDGSINTNGSIEFCGKNKQLVEDLAFVLRSLGIRCVIGTEKREGQLHKTSTGHISPRSLMYRLFIRTDEPIFYLPRKLNRIQKRVNTSRVAIKSIEYLKDFPATCIMVNNESHLFLTRDFIVTHNSFWASQLVILHEIITDGAKEYTEESIKSPAKVELFVGAAIASKSAELLEKTLMALNNLPGTWKQGTDEEIPAPLYKRATGSLLQPGKVPWTCKYQKKFGGEWQWVGSHSSIKHGTWTIENPEAAAGGRYNIVVCEEFGLLPNSIQVHMSNIPTMYIEHKFGSALYLGTGGNIEKVQQSQTIFSEPESYDSLEFDDIWENTGKIGYFIPATYSNRKFKDANGNTMVEDALAYYLLRREKAKKAKTSSAIDMEMQNYPLVPSEMFLNKNRNAYPLSDLKYRLAELLTNDKLLNSTYKGRFIITEEGEVKWSNEDIIPIREYPLKNDNVEGCIEMFYVPQKAADGSIPYGRYIAALDPIDDDDNTDNALSLQSFFIYDLWTEKIVLEYSARTKFAKDFYEQCRRGLLYFNARLLYENQKKGVFTYFDTKNCLYLLEDTPPELRDMDMQKGSTVGNKGKGIYATPTINKWGRSELGPAWMNSQAVNKPDGVTNVNTLLSVGLIKEAMLYNPEVNADRISAFGILMIYREIKIKYKPEKEAKTKTSYSNDKFFERTYGYTKQRNMFFNS